MIRQIRKAAKYRFTRCLCRKMPSFTYKFDKIVKSGKGLYTTVTISSPYIYFHSGLIKKALFFNCQKFFFVI